MSGAANKLFMLNLWEIKDRGRILMILRSHVAESPSSDTSQSLMYVEEG